MSNPFALLRQILARLASIEALLAHLLRMEITNMRTIDDLVTDFSTMMTDINAQIAALKTAQTDPATAAKIDALDTVVQAKIAEFNAAAAPVVAAAAAPVVAAAAA